MSTDDTGVRQERAPQDIGVRAVIARMRRPWAWLLAKPTGRWLLLGGLVGITTGTAGAIFQATTDALARLVLAPVPGIDATIAISHTPEGAATIARWPWLLPAIMAVGGLAAGVMCQRFARAARGGGTGVAIQAFHSHRGIIPVRLTVTKLVSSVLTLGSGGSGGREGPISLVGAGIGSLLAERLRLTAHDRRVLLVAGIAGGIAAVFRAPLTAAIYAIEVLYRGPDLETDALIPCFIAAATGYVSGTVGDDILQPLMGGTPTLGSTLFTPPALSFHTADWMQLVGYTAIACVGAVAAWVYARCMRATRSVADTLRVPAWCIPGLGAGLAGIIALAAVGVATLTIPGAQATGVALATVGSGYSVLHWLFAGGGEHIAPTMLVTMLAALTICRAAATALTVGSGGSGGLFGPSLVIGGCAGGAVGTLLANTPVGPPVAASVLMGMAAVLSATHRTPVAALLMVGEIAGTWLLLVPAMWVSGLAFLIGRSASIIGGQADDLAGSAAHRSRHFADPLRAATIKDLLAQPHPWTLIRPDQTLMEVRLAFQEADHDALPVVDASGRFHGVIARGDVTLQSLDQSYAMHLQAADLATGAGEVLHDDEALDQALRRLHGQRMQEMAITDASGRFVGMVSLGQIATYYRHAVEGIERDKQSDHSLDVERSEHPRGDTAAEKARADALAD